jgi:hypothetical protein
LNENREHKLPFPIANIFAIKTEHDFNVMALEVFRFQLANNTVYREYCQRLNVDAEKITHYSNIPFLPIQFFKTHQVKSTNSPAEIEFTSSGTTGITSRHEVVDLKVYETSFLRYFTDYFGKPEDCIILGLLPAYLEREGSSLIYMVDTLIKQSNNDASGFFLHDHEKLLATIAANKGKRIILFGVTYALLDLMEGHHPDLQDCIIIETGGMKGRRKELTKEKLHDLLKEGFNVPHIYSEYGMTELLSQAYSKGTQFKCPSWMKVLIREYNDPFQLVSEKSGGINIIDLANVYSCSFIATQDLGKKTKEYFEVLGRFDHADLRGCNFLVQ